MKQHSERMAEISGRIKDCTHGSKEQGLCIAGRMTCGLSFRRKRGRSCCCNAIAHFLNVWAI
eukprot:2781274-Alexandrium_andersonii.AAC.1